MKNKLKIIKTTMFLLFILGGSGLCLADNKAQAADWYSPDWEYRKVITVDNMSSTDALTNYQVLVTLNATNFDYYKANTDGSDLRFADSDEITEISYWTEEWNTSGDSRIWVKVPSIPAESTTNIYLYYGNASATTSLSSFDDTMQKLEVDTNTAALWHFDEEVGSTLGDSSIYTNDGTMINFAIDDSDWTADSTSEYGGSGSALNFDGVDNYIEVLHDASLNLGSENFTIEGWVKLTATGPNDMGIINKYIEDPTPEIPCDHGISLYLNNFPDYSFHYTVWDTEENESGTLISETIINDGNWHYFAALREGTKIKLYIDGEFEKEKEAYYLILNSIDAETPLIFGQLLEEAYFDGQLDEFRISTRVLTANEIKANYERRQYASQEPTNILGAEETDPYDASETVIAADGGTVANTADTAEVTISADALSSDTIITIEATEETGSFQVQGVEPIDYIYTFGPEGTEFSSPVTLTFNYDDTGMTVEEENNLDIYYYNTEISSWEAQGATVDTTLNTLVITVDHFCEFIVGINTANIALSNISELLLLIDNYSDDGKIRVEVNGEMKTFISAYFLKVHLKRAQKLIREERYDKSMAVLNKFIEKVERFTPHLIDEGASAVITTKTNEIIDLL